MIDHDEAVEWAEHFLEIHASYPDYGLVYEDDEFREKYPDEEDWRYVFDLMCRAKLEVRWE